MDKPIRIPGPDHPIVITPTKGRVVVTAGGRIIAETHAALTLQEASYPPVQYIPRADADMTQLSRTEHTTYCPYKGDATYYSLPNAENAIWSYEAPHSEMDTIKDYLAFYPDRVDSIEVSEA